MKWIGKIYLVMNKKIHNVDENERKSQIDEPLKEEMKAFGIHSIMVKMGDRNKITRVSFSPDTSEVWEKLLSMSQRYFFENQFQINDDEQLRKIPLEEQEIDTEFPKHIYSSVLRKNFKSWIELTREQQKERIQEMQERVKEQEKKELSEVEIKSVFEPAYKAKLMDDTYQKIVDIENKKIIYSQIVVNNRIKELEKTLETQLNKETNKKLKKALISTGEEISIKIE